jgi:hypothetical protein
MQPKWQLSIERFSQIWLQNKHESKFFENILSYFWLPEFFHNFDRILAIENLKKILDFSTLALFVFL